METFNQHANNLIDRFKTFADSSDVNGDFSSQVERFNSAIISLIHIDLFIDYLEKSPIREGTTKTDLEFYKEVKQYLENLI